MMSYINKELIKNKKKTRNLRICAKNKPRQIRRRGNPNDWQKKNPLIEEMFRIASNLSYADLNNKEPPPHSHMLTKITKLDNAKQCKKPSCATVNGTGTIGQNDRILKINFVNLKFMENSFCFAPTLVCFWRSPLWFWGTSRPVDSHKNISIVFSFLEGWTFQYIMWNEWWMMELHSEIITVALGIKLFEYNLRS